MNWAVIMGRLTRDPEYRSTINGHSVARYSLAVDRVGDGVDFIPCVAWDKSADFANRNFKKGMRILVSGRIQTGSYTNRDGQKVNTTELIAVTQEFADSKKVDLPDMPAEELEGGLPWNEG